MNLGIGEVVIRMGSAKDTINAKIPLVEVQVSNRTDIIERSRQRYCCTRGEVVLFGFEQIGDAAATD